MKHKAQMLLLAFGGLGLALWVPGCMIRSGFDIVREASVWERGETATDVSASAEESTAIVFRSYDVDVSYTVADGTRHHADADFYSLWKQSWTFRSTPVVKYDPADPGSFALSWSRELGWGRWAAIPFIALPSFVMGLLLFWVGISDLRSKGTGSAGSSH